MITVQLLPYAEKKAATNPLGLQPPPLYHQMRTFEALGDAEVVMNSYNTGTGKTIASLLHLFRLKGTGKNVLFIAPTNALLGQHADDIEKFVEQHELGFKVLRVTAAYVRQLEPGERPGKVLHGLLRNLPTGEGRRQPLILVVNPDIFYYALFVQYGQYDQRNLLEDFLLKFDYVVIDEFHYYDSKQLANFLFVLALFDQFGYFEMQGRKVCLLSATPSSHVRTYLDRLFPNRWRLVSPDNEPAEAATLETAPSLAPLTLTLLEGALTDWVAQQKLTLRDWVAADQDGAVISGSLWQVNQAYSTLRSVLPEAQMGRITGPESAESRQTATACRLILASPTVDIGYNFKKAKKQRQNIDFLVCDARHSDELLQRIGRAGRVLGQRETDRPSQGVVLLPEGAEASLAALDKQTMTRAAFNQAIYNCPQLPPKHNLTQYISTHAITECFYPIYKLGGITPPEYHVELEALFDRVRDAFAPGLSYNYGCLKRFFRKYEARQRWYKETEKGDIPVNKETAEQWEDWYEWHGEERAEHLSAEAIRRELRAFVNSQITITKALFNFRDSFAGPRAVVYDPGRLFSRETVNVYDLFHLLRHYRLSPPLSRQQFLKQFPSTNLEGDFYFKLLDWRERKIKIDFAYDSGDDQNDFEKIWCRAPVGISGLRVRASDEDGNRILPFEISDAISHQTIPCLIVPPDSADAAFRRMWGSSVWPKWLTVHFPDGTSNSKYLIFLGKDAFFAHAELRTHFWLKDRLKAKAIIL